MYVFLSYYLQYYQTFQMHTFLDYVHYQSLVVNFASLMDKLGLVKLLPDRKIPEDRFIPFQQLLTVFIWLIERGHHIPNPQRTRFEITVIPLILSHITRVLAEKIVKY